MAVALFIDLLGARRKWQEGGVPEATRTFRRFARMVTNAANDAPTGAILDGGIETDSAMLICDNPITALSIAQRLYREAFQNARRPDAPRLWLRGSLVPFNSSEFIRREAISATTPIKIFTYSPHALDAISIEKSGFKGMRLLIREEVVDDEVRAALRIPFGRNSFIPLRRLRHSIYPEVPEVIGGKLLDFLWMATRDESEWNDITIHMTSRLRHSAKDPEEFAHAAATQVVFHECAAIRQSVITRARRNTEGGIAEGHPAHTVND